MNLPRHHTVIVFCAVLCLAFGLRTARANLYTYDLNAPTGYGGGTLSGTITFSGNTGDPVPALNLAPSFILTYTPPSGPAESWTQSDTVAVGYNAGTDFGGGLLGDPTLTAVTIPSGLDYWAATNASVNTVDLYWGASPYGPGWEVNPSPTDYVYNVWSLNLQSEVVTPEPRIAGWAGLAAVILLVGGRRGRRSRRI